MQWYISKRSKFFNLNISSFPVFSLVLDTDLKGYLALQTPELYKELTKGRSLSYKTFLVWVLVSVYQGKRHLVPSYSDPNDIIVTEATSVVL